ncbi:MAG TPA: fumarylacetoacetate hydrolase family protein [Anaerolineae bacterium]|nr:fumarylacetoacetate hydrolase family protein [Anaerolineae bacterium]
MRFLTFCHDQRIRLGLAAGNQVVDLALADPSLHSEVRTFIEAGTPALAGARRLLRRLAAGEVDARAIHRATDLELLSPVPHPSKVVAVGVNYLDHCREAGIEPPDSPVLFAKFSTAVIGPAQPIVWDPELTNKVDYEAELAVVIGTEARHIPAERALDVVFGYMCANDVSARDLQRSDGQWVRAKSLDTFCPLGPHLVTADETPDPGALRIASRVNGVTMQDSSTSEMLFGVPVLIEFITRAFTLLPGDVILTGTPAGVGAYRKPALFLQHGDVVEIEIEGLGVLRNPCHELA